MKKELKPVYTTTDNKEFNNPEDTLIYEISQVISNRSSEPSIEIVDKIIELIIGYKKIKSVNNSRDFVPNIQQRSGKVV